MHTPTAKIVVTAGEPAGIGPDLCIQVAQLQQPCSLTVVADPELLTQRAQQLSMSLELIEHNTAKPIAHTPGVLSIIPVTRKHAINAGALDARNAAYVLE